MTESQFVPEQRSWNPEIMDFSKFSKKTKVLTKFERLDKRGFELTAKRGADPCPPGNPRSQTEHGAHGTARCLAALRRSCSSAEHGRLERGLDFIPTTEHVRVTGIPDTAATGKK